MICIYTMTSWSWSRSPPFTPLLTCLYGMEHRLAGNSSNQLGNIVKAQESKFSFRMYMAQLMCPLQNKICPIPALLIHTQIITNPPTNFTMGIRHCVLWAPPGLCLAIRWPGDRKSFKKIWLNSEDDLTLVFYSLILFSSFE